MNAIECEYDEACLMSLKAVFRVGISTTLSPKMP